MRIAWVMAWVFLMWPAVLLACGGDRSNLRACFGNQRIIIGATEMYRIDQNLTAQQIFDRWGGPSRVQLPVAPATWAEPIPVSFLEQLVKDGYLQTLPQDPGEKLAVHDRYVFTSWGYGIFCLRHGEIQPPEGAISARDQLVAHQICAASLLERADTGIPGRMPPDPFQRWLFLINLALFLPAILLGAFASSRALLSVGTWLTAGSLLVVGPLMLLLDTHRGFSNFTSGPLAFVGVALYLGLGFLLCLAIRGCLRFLTPRTSLYLLATKGGAP